MYKFFFRYDVVQRALRRWLRSVYQWNKNSQITDYWLLITDYWLLITDCWLLKGKCMGIVTVLYSRDVSMGGNRDKNIVGKIVKITLHIILCLSYM